MQGSSREREESQMTRRTRIVAKVAQSWPSFPSNNSVDCVGCQLAGLADYDLKVILSAKLRPLWPTVECINNPRLKILQHLDYIRCWIRQLERYLVCI